MRADLRRERRGEEAVGRAAESVVNPVRPRDPREVRNPLEKANRQPAMDQPVVADEIGEPEERHPETGAQRERTGDAVGRLAPVNDEHDRDWRVQRREHVVRLEGPGPAAMVARVNGPQDPVPDRAVEERGPRLHRDRDDERYAGRQCHERGAHDRTSGAR
jgi:hypothetical protein